MAISTDHYHTVASCDKSIAYFEREIIMVQGKGAKLFDSIRHFNKGNHAVVAELEQLNFLLAEIETNLPQMKEGELRDQYLERQRAMLLRKNLIASRARKYDPERLKLLESKKKFTETMVMSYREIIVAITEKKAVLVAREAAIAAKKS